MSVRQPVIHLNDMTIAHDEIVELTEIELFGTQSEKSCSKTQKANAVKLINGKIIPLSSSEIDRIVHFFHQHDH